MNIIYVFVTYFLSLFLAFSWVFADETKGSIVLLGGGAKSSSPEYAALNVTVFSRCYDSSQQATQENSKLALVLYDILGGFKKIDRDRLTASGGGNHRRTEVIETGDRPKVLCEMKWRTEHHMRLEIADLNAIPEIQDALSHAIGVSMGQGDAQVAQTYAEIERPEFRLYPETAMRLRNGAQVAAYDDARSQFVSLQTRCDFKEPKLISISLPEYQYSMKRLGAIYSPEVDRVPVAPDEIEVSAQIRMNWEFEPSERCKR